MKENGKVSVALDPDLYERIQDRVRRTRFDSPEEYVDVVLREVVATAAEDSPDGAEDLSDDGEVESRLESLGYLE